MALVTLVPERNAVEGYEFIYVGPTPNCKACKIKNACMSLNKGRVYRVSHLREIVHDCKLHEKVRVVEVETVQLRATVEAKLALENTILTVDPKKCDNLECDLYFVCNPRFFPEGKHKVIRVEESEVRCPEGKSLRIVVME